jgi:hypothetical protein
MANYGAKLTKAITSTAVGLGSIAAPGAGMRRVAIYDILFGSSAAGDTQFVFDLQRITAAATGDAVTPDPLDLADPASVTLALENLTVNGTLTAGVIPLSIAMNQRATVRWACRDGKEIIIPATADAGIQVNTPTALLTPPAQASIMFEER